MKDFAPHTREIAEDLRLEHMVHDQAMGNIELRQAAAIAQIKRIL